MFLFSMGMDALYFLRLFDKASLCFGDLDRPFNAMLILRLVSSLLCLFILFMFIYPYIINIGRNRKIIKFNRINGIFSIENFRCTAKGCSDLLPIYKPHLRGGGDVGRTCPYSPTCQHIDARVVGKMRLKTFNFHNGQSSIGFLLKKRHNSWAIHILWIFLPLKGIKTFFYSVVRVA